MERGKKNAIASLTLVFAPDYCRSRRTYAGELHQEDDQATSQSTISTRRGGAKASNGGRSVGPRGADVCPAISRMAACDFQQRTMMTQLSIPANETLLLVLVDELDAIAAISVLEARLADS